MGDATTDRPGWWKWQVCGLLLLATAIMYMDRQTLANVSVRVTADLGLTERQYGDLEKYFSWAFAGGAVLFGVLADRVSVRWLYPAALVGWSAAGVLTGLSRTYEELLACRTLLGLFEAGNWPCALVTTQRLLSRADRGLGNGILQSGATVGAVLTPLVVLGLIRWADPDESARLAQFAAGGGAAVAVTGSAPAVWPLPFLLVGAAGVAWVGLWFALVGRATLDPPADAPADAGGWGFLRDRRFWVLAVTIIAITLPWQLVRAWLPKFLMQGRGYPEATALLFNSGYFIAADVGCLLAGVATAWLGRRRFGVHRSRVLVFAAGAGLTALTVVAAVLPAGLPLLGVLVLVAAGSLAMYPCYYSFTQELTTAGMGRVTGLLAFSAWAVTGPFQPLFGKLADDTGSYDLGFALAGLPPLAAVLALVLLWPRADRD